MRIGLTNNQSLAEKVLGDVDSKAGDTTEKWYTLRVGRCRVVRLLHAFFDIA